MPDEDFDVVRRCWAAASRGDPEGIVHAARSAGAEQTGPKA